MPYVHFRLGDVFPSNEPLARWAIRTGAMLNDLIRAGADALAEQVHEEDLVWRMRLTTAITYEGARAQRKMLKDPVVKQFLKLECPGSTLTAWRQADRLTDPNLGPKPSAMHRQGERLRRLRNKTFHYETDDEALVEAVLAHIRDYDSEIREAGKLAAMRVMASDEWALSMTLGLDGAPASQCDPDPRERSLMVLAREATLSLMTFAHEALSVYVSDPTRAKAVRLSNDPLDPCGQLEDP